MGQHEEFDDRLGELLVRFDAELAAGTNRGAFDTSSIDDDDALVAEWEADRRCLELLDRVRRRWSPLDDSAETAPPVDLATPVTESGRMLGRFRILGELGHGGLGTVYLAYDPQLRRQVALKVPRLESLASAEMRRRFLREAEAAARLSHPHLVPVHETGEANAVCYIAAEFCPGPTLAGWLKQLSGPVPVATAARIVAQLADGVQHAHGRGVLHRDIKPSNVLLAGPADANGTAAAHTDAVFPRLTDFGMAKLQESEGDDTRSGALIGTPAYMSPEQARGQVRDLDARTDVYALGAILYELLCGRRMFDCQSDVESLRSVLFEEPLAPRAVRREIPRDLEAICLKCVAKTSSERYATAQQLHDDLHRFLEAKPTEARPAGMAGRIAKWCRRRPMSAALAAVICLSAAGLAGMAATYHAKLNRSNVQLGHALDSAKQLLYAADMQAGFDGYRHGSLRTVEQALQPYTSEESARYRTLPWQVLHHLTTANGQELYRHENRVLAIACSADGKFIASAEINGLIRLWNRREGRFLQDLQGHTDDVNDLVFSPDGRLLASAADDGTVRIWTLDGSADSAAKPQVLADFKKPGVYAVAFSADGKLLAAGGEDARPRVYDTRDFMLLNTLSAETGVIRSLAFFANGEKLAICGGEAAHVFSVATGERVLTLNSPENKKRFGIVAIDAAETTIATGHSQTSNIYLYSAETGDPISNIVVDSALDTLAFSPDGRTLATGLRNGTVRLWNLGSNNCDAVLVGHRAEIRGMAFSADGRELFTSGDDGLVKSWDLAALRRGTVNVYSAEAVENLAVQPHGRLCAMVDALGDVTLIDMHAGAAVFHLSPGPAGKTFALSFSSDGRYLAYATSLGREVQIFDVDTLKVGSRISLADGHAAAIAFGLAGDVLIATDRSQLLRCNPVSGETLLTVDAGQYEICSVVPLLGRKQLLVAGKTSIKLRNERTFSEEGELAYIPQPIRSVAVSPDERLVVATTSVGVLPVWDLNSKTLSTVLANDTGWGASVAFHPNGDSFVSCHYDSTLRFWDTRTLRTTGAINWTQHAGPEGSPRAVGFSHDGHSMAVAASLRDCGTTTLWSLNQTLADPQGPPPTTVYGKHTLDNAAPTGGSLQLDAERRAFFRDVLIVGSQTQGALQIDRGIASANRPVYLGYERDSVGRIALTNRAVWINNRAGLHIGHLGTGTLTIDGESVARSIDAYLGEDDVSKAFATVRGHSSRWEIGKVLVLGGFGSGTLAVEDQGFVSVDTEIIVGERSKSHGVIRVGGIGSLLDCQQLKLGRRGHGTLEVSAGAWVKTRLAHFGHSTSSSATATIAGTGSRLICSENLFVGQETVRANLSVTGGARVDAVKRLHVAPGGVIELRDGAIRTATLELDEGTIVFERGTISVAGHAHLSGMLKITPAALDGVPSGQSLRVIKYGSHDGSFTIEPLPDMTLEAIYGETALDIIVRRNAP